MNTNIDDYSNDDIIGLLQITKEDSHKEETVREMIKRIINDLDISDSHTPNEQRELTNFFRKCYLRLGVVRKFPITEDIREELNLNELNSSTTSNNNQYESTISTVKRAPAESSVTEEATEIPSTQSRSRVLTSIPYEDSLPQPIPVDRTIRTKQTKYALGNVNPIDRDTIKHILILHSKFRVNNNGASFTNTQSDRIRVRTMHQSNNYQLCNKLTNIRGCETTKSGDIGSVTDFTVELTSPYRDAISMKVAGFSFDNFYYPISEYLGTNQITFTAFTYDSTAPDPSGTVANVVTETIRVPDGYYGIEELVIEMNSIFAASLNSQIKAIEIFHDTIKNKVVFRVKSSVGPPPLPNGIKYGFNMSMVNVTQQCISQRRPLYLNLGWMLGYREETYNFFTDYNTVASQTLLIGMNPLGCVNIFGTSAFFLEINDYNNNHPRIIDYNCNTSTSYNLNNLMCRIPNISPFATQAYEDSSDRIFKKREYFGPVNISKLRVRLLDENGVPVNLNEGCFVLTLEVETLTKTTKNIVI